MVRLVEVLRKQGQIVAMTGDGVNDAPAVTKEAAVMDRPPLPPSRPILTRGLIAWLAFAGLLMAAGTLGVIRWAEQVHGLAIARTMGMVTVALFLPFFSIESEEERESAFSLGTFSGKTFRLTTSVSFVLLVLSTVLGIFRTVMRTVTLDDEQWLRCTAVALSVVAAAEIRKAFLRPSFPGPLPAGSGGALHFAKAGTTLRSDIKRSLLKNGRW